MQKILLILVATSLFAGLASCNSGLADGSLTTESATISTENWREVCRSADFEIEPTDDMLDDLYRSMQDVVISGGTEEQLIAHITPTCKKEGCGSGDCNIRGCLDCVISVFRQAQRDIQHAPTKIADQLEAIKRLQIFLTEKQ